MNDNEFRSYSSFPIGWIGRVAIVNSENACDYCASQLCLIVNRVSERCLGCKGVNQDIHHVKFKLFEGDLRKRIIV